MKAQQFGQASTPEQRSIPRRWWLLSNWLLLSVGILLIAVLVILYASQNAPDRAQGLSNSVGTIAPIAHTVGNQASPPAATAVRTPRMDAGTQGTLNYIRVHDKIPDWEILHYFHADKVYTY